MDENLRRALEKMTRAAKKEHWERSLDINPPPTGSRELTWQTAMHDAASALGLIRREAEGLLLDRTLEDESRARAWRIHAEAVKVRDLLEDHLGRGSNGGANQPIDPNDVIRGPVEMLRRTTSSRVVVEMDLEPRAWNLVGDPALLGRAVTNLVLNADEAIDGAGVIQLSTRNLEIDAKEADSLGLHAPGRYVRMAVSDSGPGIPENVVPYIFRAHFSTKRRRAQRGLGLNVVRQAVDHAGGVVRLHRGELTTFALYVPAEPPAECNLQDTEGPAAQPEV